MTTGNVSFRLIGALAGALACGSALAAGRTLVTEVVIDAPPAEVWRCLATTDGVKSWIAPVADVDLRIGGAIRTNYNGAAALGDPGTITLEILSYEPERMLSFRFDTPADRPDLKAAEQTWTVVRLEPLPGDRTRVTETMLGWPDGPAGDSAYAFFDKGNAFELGKLRKNYERADNAARAEETMNALRGFAGAWTFRKEKPDGTVFRGRTESSNLFGGKLVYARGWLGDEAAMFEHSHFLAYLDPTSGVVRIWNFNQNGDVTDGVARLEGEHRLVLEWDTVNRDGDRVPYRVVYTLEGPDSFGLEVFEPDARAERGAMRRLVEVRYTRASSGEAAAAGAN